MRSTIRQASPRPGHGPRPDPVRRCPRVACALLLGTLPWLVALSLRAQEVAPRDTIPCAPRLALVLSGGGAKGLAHVGVLEALDSLGIRPDLVVGTSMGALVGALYASGMSGRQIDSLVRAVPLGELFRRGRNPALTRLGGVIEPVESLDPLLVWERRERTLELRSPAVREDAVNALLTSSLLPGDLQAAGDFDRLAIRFRAVATDLRNRRMVVLDSGDLARAVRASIAIPGVFTPVVIQGRPLIDGGFSANVPLRPARALGARRIIVSDVIERPEEELTTASPVVVLDQVLNLLLHEPGDSIGPGDTEIRPPTAGVGILDFTPAAATRLIEAGRRVALDTQRHRPELYGPASCRAVPPGPAPPPALVDELRARLQALAVLDPKAVWLHPERIGDSLALKPVAELPPGDRIAVGLGYDNQRGGHAWVGAEDFGVLGSRARVGGVLYLGELQKLAMLHLAGPGLRSRTLAVDAARDRLPDPRTGRPPWGQVPGPTLRIGAAAHAREHELRTFDDGRLTGSSLFRDVLVWTGAELESPRGWQVIAGPVAQWWSGGDSIGSAAAAAGQVLGGIARIGWQVGPAVAGIELAAADGFSAEALWTTRYRRVSLAASAPGRIGTVALRLRALAGAGDHLPSGETFTQGGRWGFPGLVIDERRGDRLLSASLTGTRWIQGPLYARLELATGTVARGGMLLPRRGWGSGISAGGLVVTPLGSITVSYGVNTYGRGAAFIQLGEP